MGVSTIFMQIIRTIRDSIVYIKEFDDAMVSLQKVTEFTDETYQAMGKSAIDLGKALGKSSIDIMKAYAEFGRVTKVREEIEALAKTAVMASNVTSLTSQSAAEALNTAMIVFKVNAKDSIKVLDQWNELQNNYRVSAENLAASISRVGAVAEQTGMSLNKLNAITTAITSATGVSGEVAGTAIKGVLSRMFRIGAEGEGDAGKSEKQLNELGIAVRKTNEEFRNSEDILDSLAEKWEDLSSIEQINIAQTLAGTHHYAKFLAIMNNYDIVLRANISALNSQGSAFRENEKYLDSITGKMEIFKATMQEKYTAVLSSQFFKDTITNVTILIQRLGNFETVLINIGTVIALWKGKQLLNWFMLLPAQITTSSVAMIQNRGALIGMSAAQITATTSTKGLALSLNALKVALLSNPWGVVAIALTSAYTAYKLFSETVEETAIKVRNTNEAFKSQQGEIKNLIESYKASIELAKTDDKVKQQLISTESRLKTILGEKAKALSLENGDLKENIKLIKELSSEKLSDYIITNKIRVDAMNKKQEKITPRDFGISSLTLLTNLENSYDAIASLGVKETSISANKIKKFEYSAEEYIKILKNIRENEDELIKKGIDPRYLDQINTEYEKQTKILEDTDVATKSVQEAQKQYIEYSLDGLENLTKVQKGLYDQFKEKIINPEGIKELFNVVKGFSGTKDSIEKTSQALNNMLPEESFKSINEALLGTRDSFAVVGDTAEEAEAKINGIDKKFKDSIDNIQTLNTALQELSENHKLSSKSQEEILLNYPQLLQYMDDEVLLSSEIQKLKKTEQEALKQLYLEKLNINDKYFKHIILTNGELVNKLVEAYGTDAKNFETFAEAKRKTNNLLLNSLGLDWINFYKTEEEALEAIIVNADIISGEKAGALPYGVDDLTPLQKEFISNSTNSNNSAKKQLEALRAVRMNMEASVEKIDLKGFSESKVGSENLDRSDVKSNEKLTERELYFDVNNEIERYNSLINESEGIVKNTKNLSDQNAQLLKQRELYEGLQEALHEKAEITRREREGVISRGKGLGFEFLGVGDEITLENSSNIIEAQRQKLNTLKDYKTQSDKDIYDSEKQKFDDMQKLAKRFFDIQNKEIFEYGNKYTDIGDKIVENINKINDNKIDILFTDIEKNASSFNKELDLLKNKEKSINDDDFTGKKALKTKQLSEVMSEVFWNAQRLKDLEANAMREGITKTEEYSKRKEKLVDIYSKQIDKVAELKKVILDTDKEALKSAEALARDLIESERRSREIVIENQERALSRESELKEREFTKKEWELEEKLKNLESDIFGGTQSDYEDQMNNKINLLQKQSDELEKQENTLEKQKALQQKLLDLEKARQELENTKNERNSRLYTGEGFEWVANPKSVRDAQEKVNSLQEDYNEIQLDQEAERKKEKIKEEIDTNKKLLDEKKESFEEQKAYLEEALEKERETWNRSKITREWTLSDENFRLNKHYRDMEGMTAEYLSNMQKEYKNGWTEIIKTLTEKVSEASALNQKLNALNIQSSGESKFQSTLLSEISGKASSGSANTVAESLGYKGYGKGQGNAAFELAAKASLESLDTGGYTGDNVPPEGAVALLHKKELLLNPKDTENILNTTKIVKSIQSPISSALTSNSNSNTNIYNVRVDKVVSENAEQFWKNIEGYARKKR